MLNRLEDLRLRRAAILGLAAKYGVRRVRVFGSVARGDAGPASDVDLLVQFGPDRSILDQIGFQQDVAGVLGCNVDVVSEGGINPHIEATVLREAVPL